MNLPSKSVDRLRQEAKIFGKKNGISHTEALEVIARSYSFPNWKAVLHEADVRATLKRPTPKVSIGFIAAEDVVLDSEDLNTSERSEEPPELIKIKVDENKAFFARLGIEYSLFEPTITGLKKSILDATRPVRTHFEIENFHSYSRQGQGEEHKVLKNAFFVDPDELLGTQVSIYRPKTKQGDPRMWFKGLQYFAAPADQVAMVVIEGSLYLFNFSKFNYSLLPQHAGAISEVIAPLTRSLEETSSELLLKLREIAKSPIKAFVKGDTAVGMAVELALGISANCDKKPDYKGIELKAGRGKKSRTSLFAQVADWKVSTCKSSADILEKYGYQRGEDYKLYCTISTQKANSQGLKFYYDETLDNLIEKDADDNEVAIWPGELLRRRFAEKHAETFWIHAKSMMIDGEEHFELISVIHTKRPLLSQLLPLIQSGVVTMDHLIKKSGGEKPKLTEKGPLFKINKRDLQFLFPEPKTYSLKQ